MSLQTFDTVLAFAVVMLILSLFITAWVQFLSALLRLRSGNLEWGLRRLMEQLDPEGKLTHHRDILVREVLQHPALARDSTWFGRKAEAIKPDELVKALKQLATAPDADSLASVVKDWVASLSPQQGQSDAQAQIDAITAEAGKLFPQQTTALREAVERAIRGRDEVALRVSQWFDSAMDRTSERFALQCRWLTVVGAGVLVLALGVDALWIMRQLNDKPELRGTLIAQVPDLQARNENKAAAACDLVADAGTAPAAGAPASGPSASEAAKACVELRRQELQAARTRIDQGVTPLLLPGWWAVPPAGPSDGSARPSAAQGAQRRPGGIGLVLSFVLLSLGAPFWFNVLKNLSSLRPLVAAKADGKST